MGERTENAGGLEIEKNLVMNKEDYIFGTRAVIEAIKNGKPVDKVLVKKGGQNELHTELFQLIREYNIPVQAVPIEKINRITRKNHQGTVALLSPIEFENIGTILPGLFEKGVNPFILILDQITDVRNFGAIVRSAECVGVHAIIIPERGMARISADAVKTSAGALLNVPVCREKSLTETLQYLKNSGMKIIAANEKAQTSYTETKMDVPLAIVLGSEDKGISSNVLKHVDVEVKIPIMGKIGSLNVSVAVAVMLYEAVRQKIN